MSYDLILPFFPPELRPLLSDPSISDLMINGTTGVYADKSGILVHIPLTQEYTNERLTARSSVSLAFWGKTSRNRTRSSTRAFPMARALPLWVRRLR